MRARGGYYRFFVSFRKEENYLVNTNDTFARAEMYVFLH